MLEVLGFVSITYLTTRQHPILLPPRLGAIMEELADRPPTRLMIHHGPDAPRWLFPGRVPGQPIDNHSLTNRLNRHGISARPARNGALMALAADLPAAIIADLLGMHITTAIRWVRYAGRDWAEYLAARATEQDKMATGRSFCNGVRCVDGTSDRAAARSDL